ncbi:hypothetical protein P168DRAFT_257297 [Aspergillus campestris IBT 28561]|uniref:Uncharacterized protein n=1 Tax=Aspergillus campestris (strain IBT 28561) TaxID=1392248 RepID=A0A2I1CX08_ASPC2|nr:uncharacterized protein P168DRAFT_257297 [Aspergillus campestris IBT 28561]PKY02156.1 hypothetical protein P168DRAFT_257297 [Aspergillus campestris IBT 28561]
MPPMLPSLLARTWNPGTTSAEFFNQWHNPADVFSVLLILGGDVVARALAQLSGSRVTPVAFSFGWVAYSVSAVVSVFGANKLMPAPDCPCMVINGQTGYVRDNHSWIIGRMVRDYGSWMHDDTRHQLERIIVERWNKEKRRKSPGDPDPPRPTQTGLCVSIYNSERVLPGHPGRDAIYYFGLMTGVVQLGIAAIPCGIHGNWGIMVITAVGILLSLVMGSLGQWKQEKWACRSGKQNSVILTKGNGSQHAIVVFGEARGLDLEALAISPAITDTLTTTVTRVVVILLTLLWVFLLIAASALKQDTWYLLAVGGIGMLQNILAAGVSRTPEQFGISLSFQTVICRPKVMETLLEVEAKYHGVGRSMLGVLFPGKLRPQEEELWNEIAVRAAAAMEKPKLSNDLGAGHETSQEVKGS